MYDYEDPFAQATWAQVDHDGERPPALSLEAFIQEMISALARIQEALGTWNRSKHAPITAQPIAGGHLLLSLLVTAHLDLWIFAEEIGASRPLGEIYHHSCYPPPAKLSPEPLMLDMIRVVGLLATHAQIAQPDRWFNSSHLVESLVRSLSLDLRALWWMVRGAEVHHAAPKLQSA